MLVTKNLIAAGVIAVWSAGVVALPPQSEPARVADLEGTYESSLGRVELNVDGTFRHTFAEDCSFSYDTIGTWSVLEPGLIKAVGTPAPQKSRTSASVDPQSAQTTVVVLMSPFHSLELMWRLSAVALVKRWWPLLITVDLRSYLGAKLRQLRCRS